MSLTSVDLLEELRAALDELEPLLAGRIVDIEMSRVRVLADRGLFRRERLDVCGTFDAFESQFGLVTM